MQTALDRPRFRQDLVAEPIDDAGDRFIDVMDPDSGNVFRFFEVEYSLACAMDGERDVPGIVQWAKEELGLTPSLTEVRTVIATLGDLGFIDLGSAGAAAAAARPAPTAVPTVKSHWDDAPTMLTNADDVDDLRPGVVVGGRRTATPVADMELGHAGTSEPGASADLPNAPAFELGSPGTAGRPARAPDKTQVDDIPLGMPGRADVSVDLSDSVGVGVDDVKEAVRASQVMKAVDVPKELLDSLESEPDRRPPPSVKPIEAAPAPKPVAKPIEVASKAASKPAEQPKAVAKPAAEAPKAPKAPASAVSPALLVLLAVVVLGAIAFIAYKFLLKKSEDAQSSATPVQPHVQQPPAPQPEPPPPPPVETVKLATSADTSAALKPAAAGQIETIAGDAAVNAGDVVVRFVGHKPLETEIAGVERDIEKRVQPELAQAEKDRDAAQTANNKALLAAAEGRIADRKKSLDDKQAKLAQKKTELDRFVIRAPAAGKLTAKVKAGARVSPSDVVAELAVAPVRIATFTKAPPVAPKARVLLVTKTDHKNLACVVTVADPGALTVECPADAAAAGTDVTYGGLDPSPPPANAEIEMGDEAKGSAAVAPPPPAPHPTAAPRPAPHPAPAPDKGSAEAAPAPAPSGSASE